MNLKQTLPPAKRPLVVLSLLALAVVAWAYWPALAESAQHWANDPQYSHGYLVPLFAVALLWLRRGQMPSELATSFWGLPLLAVALGLYLAGSFFYVPSLEAVSLVPCLAGLALLIGGRPALQYAWPAIGFLVFMFPLPYRLSVAMGGTLQRIATIASTFVLQAIGLPAISEGNVIHINEHAIGIVEACSGLRMLVVFFALSTAVALLIDRRLWERLVIVASAVPIALVSNLIRIVATGLLHTYASSEAADAFFHDFAGWIMMPLGLSFLWLELKILDNLFIEVQEETPAPFFTGLARRVPRTS